MAVSIASFVLMTVAVRQLSGRMTAIQIVCLRSAVALLILLALAPYVGWSSYRTRRLGLHAVRNVTHFTGQYAWVLGLTLAPLALVTAIEFTMPVWVALLAAVFLGERLPPHRALAIASGIAGVLVIVRPGTGGFGTAVLVVLAGTLGFAISVLFVKELLRTDRVITVVFYMSLMQLPLGLAGSAWFWVWPSWNELPWVAAIGATSLSAHYGMGRALGLGDASFVLPIDFLRLPCVALAAFLLYGERLSGWTVLGAALIVAGNYWSVRVEARAPAARPAPSLASDPGPSR